MDCCNQVIQPSKKLEKLIWILKLIIILNIIIFIVKICFNLSKDSSFSDIFNLIFIILAINTLFYLFMVFYIFFTLFNAIFSFIKLGTFLQMLLQGSFKNIEQKRLIFIVIDFIFYIFVIVISFESYKEMKGIFLDAQTLPQNENTYDEENNNNNFNNNNQGFKAFSGKGVVVGES